MRAGIAARLERHISPEPNTGCWLWVGAYHKTGYGLISSDADERKRRKNILTHRAVWTVVNGDIPDGLFVLHRCDNPPCVNPSHLFLGTQRDNIADMHAKGRASFSLPALLVKSQERTAQMRCKRGHLLTVDNCQPKAFARGHRECRKCHAVRYAKYRSNSKSQRVD